MIRKATIDDWRRARDIRLRALADAPDAFASTLADERQFTDDRWIGRLARAESVTFLAVIDGADAGIAVGAPFERDAGLFSMWVAPEARGRGASDALVRAVIAWAREAGFARLILEVSDHNAPAIALYARHGFEPTGVVGTLPPPREHVKEHQRALALR